MYSRVFLLLIGVIFIYYKAFVAAEAAADVYSVELSVESNVTLNASTLLDAFKDKDVVDGKVSLLEIEVIAECLIIGDQSSCNCTEGYIWSNDICYDHGCCSYATCTKNVSHLTPLCIAKVEVWVKGLVQTGMWDSGKETKLQTTLGELNGFEYVNVTISNTSVNFEALVSAKMKTSKLQEKVDSLKSSIGVSVLVETEGMVYIDVPNNTVCYKSKQQLKCTFDEATDIAGWNISTGQQRFELSDGSMVKVSQSCSVSSPSCVSITIEEVTGIWSGEYECGFTKGSVRHTAKAPLKVALLPDEITLTINPLTVDCAKEPNGPTIDVKATILNSTEPYVVSWGYKTKSEALSNTSDGDKFLVYSFRVQISCEKTSDPQNISVTFKNTQNQNKTAVIDVPVIYKGAPFCEEVVENGDTWPKTPGGDTVINRTCTDGKTGFKSRTCKDTEWQPVYFYCISELLNKALDNADKFLQGMNATQEGARNIFESLKNNSETKYDASESTAEVTGSITVLDVMAKASKNIVLQKDVVPDLVEAASNMLNKTWGGLNETVLNDLSSTYLKSVEDLVKNINTSKNFRQNSENVGMKHCSYGDCDVFGIKVNLNTNGGVGVKTVAMKNLTNKLKNTFDDRNPVDLLISATLEKNDSMVEIRLDFPTEQLNPTKRLCVFWNFKDNKWSDAGCAVNMSDANRTICHCNHLTSFSVLMSKEASPNKILDMITLVGLGVSISSLLIFLFIESLVWSAVIKTNLSYFRHMALVNIAVFLLLGSCSFLASSSPKKLSENWCLVLTICKHLFFVAMFSWMLCLSVMLIHQLIFVFSPLRKRVFIFLSSIVGYVCPILIVGSSYVYCKYTGKPYFNREFCWLTYTRLLEGSIHAFILPIGTVILTNLFSMVVVIITLTKTSVPDSSKADDKETVKSILKVVVFLTPVFGVTWIIGFALFILDPKTMMFTVAEYSFTILNSFQGLFILITGCFAESKVRDELLKLVSTKLKGKSDGRSESMKNLTSTMYTKDK